MSLTLYHFNNSVCSQKIRMVLKEKAVTDWESKEVDLFKSEQFDPEYLKLNPKGVVPTLVHDGNVMTESTLIAEYLDETFPDPPLKPAEPAERAQMRLYSKACDEGLHQGVAVLSYSAMFMDRLRKMSRDELLEHLSHVIDLERRDRQTAVYDHGEKAPHVYRGTVAYEKIFQKINKALSDGREWLTGGMYSLAEINLAPYFVRLEYMNLLDVWTGDRPDVTAWFDRVKARPTFQTEVVDWVHDEEWAEMNDACSRIKPQIAEFRDQYLATDKGAQIF